MENLPGFDNHKLVVQCYDSKSQLIGYIAIHRGGVKKPAFGATRIWPYKSDTDALVDALKLSRIMSYKSALAGYLYGGAKGVLLAPRTKSQREKNIEAYAGHVNILRGSFITGADVGVSPGDVQRLFRMSRYIVGTKIDPVIFTIRGVMCALGVSLKELFGTEDMTGRSFAIQGLGKTGVGLLKQLVTHAKVIYVSDIDENKMKFAQSLGKNIRCVSPQAIYSQRVDIFSPCALGGTLNTQSIEKLRCKGIVGSANGQLEKSSVGDILYRRGIVYAPDYVVNAGGLIAVVSEYEKTLSNLNQVNKRVDSIGKTVRKIFNQSRTTRKSPHRVADSVAEKIINSFE